MGGRPLAVAGSALVAFALACGSRTPLEGGSIHTPLGAEDASADVALDVAVDAADGAPDFGECGPPPQLGDTWFATDTPDSTNPNDIAEIDSVAVAPDGSMFVAGCGYLNLKICTLTGEGACFLAKLDRTGQVLFMDRFVDGVDDPLRMFMVPDEQGGVTVGLEADEGSTLGQETSGCMVGRFDSAGKPIFVNAVGIDDCTLQMAFAANPRGESALVGTSLNTKGALIQRFDETGAKIAQRALPEITSQVLSAALQQDGLLLVAAYAQYTADFGDGPRDYGPSSLVLVTYDRALTVQKLFSAPNFAREVAVAPTPDGAGFIVAGGYTRSEFNLGGPKLVNHGMQDIFLGRVTKTLEHVYSYGWGDSSDQDLSGLCVDPAGNVVMSGQPGLILDLGNGQVVASGTITPTGFLAWFDAKGTAKDIYASLLVVSHIGCTPDATVLGGRANDKDDLGAGLIPIGGYIVRRPP